MINNKLKNILIIEDEMLIAHSIKKMVDKHFNCVGIAKNFEEALPYFNISSLDVVLIDITLAGDKNGIFIANYLNQNHSIPFIFLTALTNANTLEKILETKPNAYLAKPIQEPNLITAINIAFLHKKEQTIQIEIGKQNYTIILNEFIYAQAESIYTTVYLTNNKSLLLRISLVNLEKLFPEDFFKRINRSEAVNPKLISKQTATQIILGDKLFKYSPKF